MADEEKKTAAGSTTAKKATKSVKKKTVKKAAKKSVKKSVKKKSVKKAAQKKSVTPGAASETTAAVVTANANGQKQKATIRLKSDQPSRVVVPPRQQKDGLATLSKIAITLLIIVGLWAFVSYLSDDEEQAENVADTAVTTTPVAPTPTSVITEIPAYTLRNAAPTSVSPATAEAASDEKSEENESFFSGIFGNKGETTEEAADATAVDASSAQPAADQRPMQYGQPGQWGPPQGFNQPQYGYGAPFDPSMSQMPQMPPMPWGPPQGFGPPPGFGPPQGYGPPPGFYDAPPAMPMFDQGNVW